MKVLSVMVLLAVLACSSAQWISSFSPRRYPQQSSGGESLDNRFGATQGPLVDRFGFEIAQVNEVENFPADKRPFWFLNRQAIAQHIGRPQSASSDPSSSADVHNLLVLLFGSPTTTSEPATTTIQ